MAGISGVIKDVVTEGAKAGVKASAKGAGAVTKAQRGMYQKALEKAENNILQGSDNIIDRAVNKNFSETVQKLGEKEARLAKTAETGIVEKAVDNATENTIEQASKGLSNRSKNALMGSAIGGISGAGIGGISGLATGADEDDTKSMIFMGALAGVTGGAMVGGLRSGSSNISKIAGEIATNGGANEAVNGGAKGILGRVGTSTQNFVDKIDDLGSNIAKKASKGERFELAKQLKKAANGEITSKEALDLANEASTKSVKELRRGFFTEIEGPDGYIKKINKAKLTKEDAEHFTKIMRNANTIGGASQGAIIGSVTGATIGGISGGIDEDETFIGGAVKGGLIGGTIGGISGGASGFINSNAKVLSNTTANVKSLFS